MVIRQECRVVLVIVRGGGGKAGSFIHELYVQGKYRVENLKSTSLLALWHCDNFCSERYSYSNWYMKA